MIELCARSSVETVSTFIVGLRCGRVAVSQRWIDGVAILRIESVVEVADGIKVRSASFNLVPSIVEMRGRKRRIANVARHGVVIESECWCIGNRRNAAVLPVRRRKCTWAAQIKNQREQSFAAGPDRFFFVSQQGALLAASYLRHASQERTQMYVLQAATRRL